MKRKTAPTGYTAVPRPVQTPGAGRAPAHPSQGLAGALVRWLDRGDTPPSLVLAQGLVLARTPVNDGLPVDQTRPGRRAADGDNRLVMGLLDRIKRPEVDRVAEIATVLRAVWVDKRSAPRPGPVSTKPHPVASARARPQGNRPAAVQAPVVIVRRSARVLDRTS